MDNIFRAEISRNRIISRRCISYLIIDALDWIVDTKRSNSRNSITGQPLKEVAIAFRRAQLNCII